MAPHPSLRDTLSPKGEGEVTTETLWGFPIAKKGNSNLAPWGSPMLITSEYVSEDARRAGEGLIINLEYEKENIFRAGD